MAGERSARQGKQAAQWLAQWLARCGATLRWSEDVLREEDRLRERADVLSDALAAHIGRLGDAAGSTQVRTALVRIRRDVFNLRLPGDPTAAATQSPLTGLAPGDVRPVTDHRGDRSSPEPTGTPIF